MITLIEVGSCNASKYNLFVCQMSGQVNGISDLVTLLSNEVQLLSCKCSLFMMALLVWLLCSDLDSSDLHKAL